MSLYNSTHLEKAFPGDNSAAPHQGTNSDAYFEQIHPTSLLSLSDVILAEWGQSPAARSNICRRAAAASGFGTTVECFPEGMLSCTCGHFEKSLVSESECDLKLLADRLSGESVFCCSLPPCSQLPPVSFVWPLCVDVL